jgi:tetratricopeptide (TPR) repeat protein
MFARLRPVFSAIASNRRARVWLTLGFAVTALAVALGVWYFRPDPRLAEAERALQRHDYAAAYALYQSCLKRNPDDASLLLLTGRTARRAGLFEQASKHLNAYRRLKGENPSLTLEWSLLRLQRGDAQVESYLQERAAAGGDDALLVWEVLAQYYLDAYRLIDARDCLDHYLEQRPNDVKALMGRAFIWDRLQHYADAVRDYRRAVELDPDNDRARFRLAENLLITGPPQDAVEQFERLRERNPEDVKARLGLARAWRSVGRIDEARQLLDELLRQDPQNVGALTERGRLALEEGQASQGADWLRRAVALAPHNREALFNLWNCLQRCGSEEEARRCRLRFERADADLKRLGQLTKEVLRDPRNPQLRYEGGMIFLNNGEEEEGVRWLHQCLRLDPNHRDAHRALADQYQRVGKSESAAHHRNLAEQAQP